MKFYANIRVAFEAENAGHAKSVLEDTADRALTTLYDLGSGMRAEVRYHLLTQDEWERVGGLVALMGYEEAAL